MAESNITRQKKAMRLLGSAEQTQCSCAVGLDWTLCNCKLILYQDVKNSSNNPQN